ncbi:hypothetical protein CAOG_03795 [Capsaspora owczarzaki ATCC 30864]|uniref:MSP domain-containing protein n=1 Tax=Capsaspora owczarzaki (strain ATCC 30864) TaxID=595528 RepID=A0A0D2WPZ3_CAPO3|nr:hypothetical protein CAOG_03795 [Capsaspora owczarzaki ATCC 30864]KJE92913.1 hypothetical protein CAOG_003795 [Capsaspora owczarzaki ATCC 30864]|eukprot:XP_004363523.2 hypothetical protein CAOG_03795 [Capsaspora owczarzaki ATCC 30864]
MASADSKSDASSSLPKLESKLVINPATELVFNGSKDHTVTSMLALSNPLNEPIHFKIKTTNPKRYSVRPNAGVVPPQSTVEVAVSLQALKEPIEEKFKDKFQVQSIVGNSGGDTMWEKKELIAENRLKVSLTAPSAAGQTSSTPAAAEHVSTASPSSVAHAPVSAAASQQAAPAATAVAPRRVAPAATSPAQPASAVSAPAVVAPAVAAPAATIVQPARPAPTVASDDSAQREIATLKSALAAVHADLSEAKRAASAQSGSLKQKSAQPQQLPLLVALVLGLLLGIIVARMFK